MIKEIKPRGKELKFSSIPKGEFFEYDLEIYLKVDATKAFNCDVECLINFSPDTIIRWRDFILKEV